METASTSTEIPRNQQRPALVPEVPEAQEEEDEDAESHIELPPEMIKLF